MGGGSVFETSSELFCPPQQERPGTLNPNTRSNVSVLRRRVLVSLPWLSVLVLVVFMENVRLRGRVECVFWWELEGVI